MSDRLVEQRWVQVKPLVMERRLDTLRRRADYLAEKIGRAPAGSRRHDETEHAALMWAIAELSGIGDEVRQEKLAMNLVTASMHKKAVARAEQAEALNAQFRVKIDALKAEVYRLSRPNGTPVRAAVGQPTFDTSRDSIRGPKSSSSSPQK